MVIIDKTLFREKTGQIGLVGLVQGTLKYGPTWQSRMKAQDVVIAIIEKQLDSNFALLRNVTLPNTEINLPMVLIGPPGVYLINVTHERGVYRAKDDEWGAMIADRFVPARINQITRTVTLGRVLQTYLDRQGFKNAVLVEPILMAADPGMQIESTRPAVRVVMSDALERFAASLSQARSMIEAPLGKDIVRSILVGKPAEVVQSEPAQDNLASSFNSFAFDDEAEQQPAQQETEWLENLSDQSASKQAEQQTPKPKKTTAKKRGLFGLSTGQLVTLGITFFVMVCILIAAIIFVLTFNG